jgi:uncharacterized membrane protein
MTTAIRIIQVVQLILGSILFLPLVVIIGVSIYGLLTGKDWFASLATDRRQLLQWAIFFMIICWGLANILSALWIRQRKKRIGTLVTWWINALFFPIGTVIDIPCLIVLLGREGRSHYSSI